MARLLSLVALAAGALCANGFLVSMPSTRVGAVSQGKSIYLRGLAIY